MLKMFMKIKKEKYTDFKMKTIVLVTNKQSGEVLPYSTLSPFLRDYPQYEKRIDSINDYLSRKKEELVIDTYTSYEAMINGHIIPALGHLKLQELTPAHIDAFIRSLKKDGARKDGKSGSLDATSIKKIRAKVSSCKNFTHYGVE